MDQTVTPVGPSKVRVVEIPKGAVAAQLTNPCAVHAENLTAAERQTILKGPKFHIADVDLRKALCPDCKYAFEVVPGVDWKKPTATGELEKAAAERRILTEYELAQIDNSSLKVRNAELDVALAEANLENAHLKSRILFAKLGLPASFRIGENRELIPVEPSKENGRG